MIKHKLLFVLLSSLLLSACAKKAEEEIVAKYEFTIDYSNGIKQEVVGSSPIDSTK